MDKKIYNSKKELLTFLGIKENFLYSEFCSKYNKFKKPKKEGGYRLIEPPSLKLKEVQRKILDEILYLNPQLPCVYGLSKEKNIFCNAKKHEKNFDKQLLILDIEKFFPNISKKYILNLFNKMGFNKENSSILTKICTVNGYLPQGAPTSPYLASMVCEKLDKEIYLYCKRRDLEYTRYFDDMSISGENITEKTIKHIEKIIIKNNFKCNSKKKDFFDFGSEKIINNILITNNGFSVTNKYKKEIIEIYKESTLSNSSQIKRVLRGKLGFYLYINKKEAQLFIKKISI